MIPVQRNYLHERMNRCATLIMEFLDLIVAVFIYEVLYFPSYQCKGCSLLNAQKPLSLAF